ncbi:DUF2157 domain-containing protein [Hymenobacter qilianensis]|uniref:DUF2157 domain-containing protein n=1 Tax=Hymenobacter qilianensis TaxID=1385715 RepID=A0A7H0GZ60_9BACT|nr:DUF2157 domain-containing protein [Hymenobacter qilianensis]QNP53576.1 DUF2157 domain-containing protein [Hymenobacter qilianensis]
MSRKLLETDGPDWVKKGIISPEQHRQLLELYPEDARAIGLLPLLGSLLVGLSALSLVAANWQGLPEWLRIGLLLGPFWALTPAVSFFCAAAIARWELAWLAWA